MFVSFICQSDILSPTTRPPPVGSLQKTSFLADCCSGIHAVCLLGTLPPGREQELNVTDLPLYALVVVRYLGVSPGTTPIPEEGEALLTPKVPPSRSPSAMILFLALR